MCTTPPHVSLFLFPSCHPKYMLVEHPRPSLQALAYSRGLLQSGDAVCGFVLKARLGSGISAHFGPQAPGHNEMREPKRKLLIFLVAKAVPVLPELDGRECQSGT